MSKKDKKDREDDSKKQKAKSGKLTQLEEKLADSEGKCSEYLELAQRVQADFENYKKRMEKDKEESRKFANQKIVEEFLDVKDNLERSLKTPENTESVVDGIKLTLKQLDNLLAKHGVEEINPEKQKFDPNFHEAMMFDEGDVTEETVSEVYQKGYQLHSRVIRPAKVKITKPKEEK